MKNILPVIDPGFLALRRSIKTFIAILVSTAIFWDEPRMAMLAAVSALLFSRSQAGNTIRERRFTMLTTGLLMALLAVPVSVISQHPLGALIFLVLFAALLFYLIGNGIVPDFPAVTLIGVSVVTMAFSHTVASGVRFAGIYLLTTLLVFTMHFVIWPTRPRKRLELQLIIIRRALKVYAESVMADYPSLEAGIDTTHQQSDRIRKSIGDFNRLWQLFRMAAPAADSPEARLHQQMDRLRRVHEYLLLLWQFRANAFDHSFYHTNILHNERLRAIHQWLIKTAEGTNEKPQQQAETYLQGMEALMDHYQHTGHETVPGHELMPVMNTLKALQTVIADITHEQETGYVPINAFSVKKKMQSFFMKTRQAFSEFGWQQPAAQFALRAAIIIGLVKAYTLYFHADFGYWLVLFAVLLIRPNLGISIKAGRERLAGTLAGGALAFVFILIIPASSSLFYVALMVSIFLMIWFANLDRMVPMVTALTFMIVGLFYLISPDGDELVWMRMIYTAVIVLLVIAGSFLLWPLRARSTLAASLGAVLEAEQTYFNSILIATGNEDQQAVTGLKQHIRDKLLQLDKNMEAARHEVLQQRAVGRAINVRRYLLRLLNTLHALEVIAHNQASRCDVSLIDLELKTFTIAANKAFVSMNQALQQRTSVKDFPSLQAPFNALLSRFREIKPANDSGDYGSLPNLWNLSALVINLKPLMLELEGIREEIDQRMKEV
ncbi:MAG: hypothetical protein EOM83_13095 [Clostridia bacterium]|nr:hypothetical protein [Clostridia bacterium]